MHCDCFKNFKDLIFWISYLRKQQKIHPLKICMHTVRSLTHFIKKDRALFVSVHRNFSMFIYGILTPNFPNP